MALHQFDRETQSTNVTNGVRNQGQTLCTKASYIDRLYEM